MAFCSTLVEQVLEVARDHGSLHVDSITLEVGALSHLDAAKIADAFPLASAGTFAEGAELIIETIPARVRCRRCGANYAPSAVTFRCNACDGAEYDVLAGNRAVLTSVALLLPRPAAIRH